MMYKLLAIYDRKLPLDQASAQCNIPCKIYDPSAAQLAVLTMLRMVDLLNELKRCSSLSPEQKVKFNRYLKEKEVQGNKIKQEIGIIWGDYIMKPHIKLQPELHHLTHKIMLSISSAKETTDRCTTLKLLDLVNQFSEWFWTTKNIPIYRAECPYPPSETLVYPDLKSAC